MDKTLYLDVSNILTQQAKSREKAKQLAVAEGGEAFSNIVVFQGISYIDKTGVGVEDKDGYLTGRWTGSEIKFNSKIDEAAHQYRILKKNAGKLDDFYLKAEKLPEYIPLEFPKTDTDSDSDEDNRIIYYRGIRYEVSEDNYVFDDEGDAIGTWDGKKVNFIHDDYDSDEETPD
jgi:hypothetical protein